MNEYAISTEGLVRRYGRVAAVDGVDLGVKKGEIYGFLGPNGAGKTTVLRILTTLLMPSEGRAFVAGRDVIKEPVEVRLRIGAALQEATLDNKQTGRELLMLQARLYGLRRGAAKRRISELEPLMDIGDAVDRQIGTYSGGMKRRLDLAAALVHNPEILFLDEPTTGLDPISRAKVWEEVHRINKEHGVTIFLTTQYLDEADELADRVGIINRGRLAAEGSPGDLKRSVASDLIIVRVDGDPDLDCEALRSLRSVGKVKAYGSELTIRIKDGAKHVSRVALALNECGVGVQELTLRTPTLDDVFLQAVGVRMEEEEQKPEEAQV